MTPRTVLNFATVLALTLATGLAALIGIAFWIAYEGHDLHAAHPGRYLLIPSALRGVEPIAQCGPVRYGRSLRECGGICGEYVSKSFGTTADLPTLKASYRMAPLLATTGYHEAQIMLSDPDPDAPETCRRAIIELYQDYTGD